MCLLLGVLNPAAALLGRNWLIQHGLRPTNGFVNMWRVLGVGTPNPPSLFMLLKTGDALHCPCRAQPGRTIPEPERSPGPAVLVADGILRRRRTVLAVASDSVTGRLPRRPPALLVGSDPSAPSS